MILCKDKSDVDERGIGVGGVCLPRKYIGYQEESAGRVKNSYVTIIDGS